MVDSGLKNGKTDLGDLIVDQEDLKTGLIVVSDYDGDSFEGFIKYLLEEKGFLYKKELDFISILDNSRDSVLEAYHYRVKEKKDFNILVIFIYTSSNQSKESSNKLQYSDLAFPLLKSKHSSLMLIISNFSEEWITQSIQEYHFDKLSLQTISSKDSLTAKHIDLLFDLTHKINKKNDTKDYEETELPPESESLLKDLQFKAIGIYHDVKSNFNNLELMFNKPSDLKVLPQEIETNDGKCSYVGDYGIHGRHGRGILIFFNGDFYLGTFQYDEFDGFGNFISLEGDFNYRGYFKDGLKHGHGILTFTSKDEDFEDLGSDCNLNEIGKKSAEPRFKFKGVFYSEGLNHMAKGILYFDDVEVYNGVLVTKDMDLVRGKAFIKWDVCSSDFALEFQVDSIEIDDWRIKLSYVSGEDEITIFARTSNRFTFEGEIQRFKYSEKTSLSDVEYKGKKVKIENFTMELIQS